MRKIQFTWLICLVSVVWQPVAAQLTDAIDAFQVNGNATAVEMIWKIKAGNTCNGIQIFRSLDSVNFTGIGTIEGVCGSIDVPQTYTFTDLNPVSNRINYYRVLLNGLGYSSIVSLPVVNVQSGGYLLFPNPSSGNINLYFSNPTFLEQTLSVYNLYGQEVLRTVTTGEKLNISMSQYPAGHYSFLLQPLNISGKFYIVP